ncbi:DUF4365 domain-containing protein [Ilyomonas limi]|uniref:DUF4365 domain-containing protein n=1 Tax=Ilyomonas limi TaxID=2575867 RepID=UPI001485B812|nr:DUF4365 domain-containing protein [Ilyomonas limi]
MGNVIGKRGESIFSTIISRYVDPAGFLLDPTFLGEKFPIVDFYVHLLNYNIKKAFFFASVKTTTLGYTADNTKLRITVDKAALAELIKYPVPVYLFGIDENEEVGFFICANHMDTNKNLSGIPTLFPVNAINIALLWKEVANYWNNNKEITKFVSHFN